MPLRREPRGLLLFLFFFSGAVGLVYQVAWTRMFSLVFGSTALAVSSVLAAFMAGLALGSWLIGRLIDRRSDEIRVYGLLEIGVGVSGLLLLPALGWVGHAFVAIYQAQHPSFFEMSLIRAGFSFLLLIVPTAFMGGTLPVLVRWWTREKTEIGGSLGRLYAVNTFGAMAGTFAAGFWLIATFGVRTTVLIAVAANFVIGIVALSLGRAGRPEKADTEPKAGATRATDAAAEPALAATAPAADSAPASSRARLALVAIGISGFLALGYEVVWTRVLLYVLSASIHAFSIMLTTFLGGLAIGSLVLAKRVDRMRAPYRFFGFLEIGVGVAALGTVVLLSRYTEVHDSLLVLFQVRTWNALALVKFVEATLVILVPTLLMGMTFPVVSRLYARDMTRVGGKIGHMVAVNTLGGVIGSFGAGFFLIPHLGTQGTIVLLAVLSALLGGGLLLAEKGVGGRWPRRIAIALVPAALVFVGGQLLPDRAFLSVFGINLREGEIVYCREGITGTVTIHDSPGSRLLSIDGADVAGTTPMLRTTQKLQAHIPLLLHPNPQKVLQVGLGSGETAHSILYHPIEELVGCDISPEVIEAGAFFGEINRDVYKNPRLRIVFEDAKNFVAYTEEMFDLILNDSVHPIFRGSSDLYARDYFEACRKRLNEDGMMASWFPTALLTTPDLRMLVNTFQQVFPQSTVWVATNGITRNALLLGWKNDQPIEIDFRRIARMFEKYPEIARDLAEVNLGAPILVLDAFTLSPESMREFTAGAKINTYDRPYLEYSAPRVLAQGDRVLWARNMGLFAKHRRPVFPYLVNVGRTEEKRARMEQRFDRRYAVSRHILQGLVFELENRGDQARDAYQRALDMHPRDPLSSALLARGESKVAAREARVAEGEGTAMDFLHIARARKQDGEFAAAEALLEQGAEIAPGNARIQLELALVRLRQEKFDGALEAVEAAIDADPRMSSSFAIRGRLRAQAGNLDGAVDDLQRASRDGGAPAWAELLLGRLLIDRGADAEAREPLLKVIDLAPNSPEADEARRLMESPG